MQFYGSLKITTLSLNSEMAINFEKYNFLNINFNFLNKLTSLNLLLHAEIESRFNQNRILDRVRLWA